jgi:hypothetical protein
MNTTVKEMFKLVKRWKTCLNAISYYVENNHYYVVFLDFIIKDNFQ